MWILLWLATAQAFAQGPCVSLTRAPYAENFDALANSGVGNNALPAGWNINEAGTSVRNDQGYSASTGADNSGDVYSFGAAGSTDRALGTLLSGSLNPSFGACFSNDTGAPVASLVVAYTGEMWRAGAANRGAADRLVFQYSLDGSTWVSVEGLNFASPATSVPTAGATDGNADAFRAAVQATISGLDIAPGATFYIRWTDFDISGADDGLAIDDFTLTAQAGSAEPSISISDASAPEGNSGTTLIAFTVSLDRPAPAGGVSFTYSTSSGTATAGSDYVAVLSATGRIAEGARSTSIAITLLGDTTDEPDETFTVTIANVTGAGIARAAATGAILNDDAPATCAPTHTIPQIQGAESQSPIVGTVIVTRGIVTARKTGSGFFLQSTTGDGDAQTSDGIFVFTGATIPAQAITGSDVCVRGAVTEFRPAADPNQQPLTELTSAAVIGVLATGRPLPEPVTLTAADTNPAGGLDVLERYESMRVRVNSLEVTAPTDGSVNEPNATSVSNGVFYGVIAGVPRPFREPGIQVPDPLPAGAPTNVPRFDTNPERIRIDSDAQPGAPALEVAAGATVGPITGPLDYGFRTYTILPDAGSPPVVTNNRRTALPAPDATPDELTIASLNLERFFDTNNDPAIAEPVLTPAAFETRLAKASKLIREVLRLPDVIGVQEVENLTTLQRLADRVNADSGDDWLRYVAYAEEGNDPGGIDVGFLVKSSRVAVIDVKQVGKDATYVSPISGQPELLNDRPPLVMHAWCGNVPFTAIVNHLRSLTSIDDPVEGVRVRAKRKAQAEYLARLIDSNENVVSVGDYNAFEFSDGYADVMGTVKGRPTPADQVLAASPDLVDPDLTDLIETLPANERYSYVFDGSAQVLDHIVVSPSMLNRLNRFLQTHANAEFPESLRGDATRVERLTDHDQPLAYFSIVQQ